MRSMSGDFLPCILWFQLSNFCFLHLFFRRVEEGTTVLRPVPFQLFGPNDRPRFGREHGKSILEGIYSNKCRSN